MNYSEDNNRFIKFTPKLTEAKQRMLCEQVEIFHDDLGEVVGSQGSWLHIHHQLIVQALCA